MDISVTKTDSPPHHRSLRGLEYPYILTEQERIINFRSNTSRTAQISELQKYRKSCKYLQIPGKYLKVPIGTHLETPKGDFHLLIMLIQLTHHRLQGIKAPSFSRSIGQREAGNTKHNNAAEWRIGPDIITGASFVET
jgi:hypothetical protein